MKAKPNHNEPTISRDLPLPYRTGGYLINDYAIGANPHIRQGTDLSDRGFRASGSRQLDEEPLLVTLKRFTPAQGTLHLVDLRQETHAFFDGKAVSLYADKDWGNVWRTPSWIADDESRMVGDIKKTPDVKIFNLEKAAEGGVVPVAVADVRVMSAKTEKMAAESVPRVVYHRLPTPDHCPPFEVLPPFLDLLKRVDPAKDWVHFHCHGGDGRTTTFLALYDMAYWFRMWKTDRFPTLQEFADRECRLFKYNLNPDYDCNRKPTTPDWKYELARERWDVLGFMRLYILNGLLFSDQPFVLPDDWKTKGLEP